LFIRGLKNIVLSLYLNYRVSHVLGKIYFPLVVM